MWLKSLIFSLSLLSLPLLADDFKLDPAPLKVRGVKESFSGISFPWLADTTRARRSDLEALLKLQTPVRSQGRRGTCSIFSATAEVESLIKIRDGKEYDLSENYLEFLVQARVKGQPTSGSDTFWNIPAFQKHGAVMETDFPYDIYDWTESDIPSDEKQRAEKTCGHLRGNDKQRCLFGHLDPTNDKFEEAADSLKRQLGLNTLHFQETDEQGEIKRILDSHRPMILSVRFFYKAWNHRKMVEIGLGDRDMDAWGKGIVSTPSQKDIQVSQKHPAGHSIVVVGYDDEKQVYYFKNSWGTGNFGVKSDFLGTGTTDGYGSISYDYAHRFGSFSEVKF